MPDAVSWSLHRLPRQNGRTAVVTGANSGIGLETARGLAGLGARVILACRNLERANVAALDIRASVPGADLDVRRLDLADLESVSAFAATFGLGEGGQPEPLDLLVHNAGVLAPPERRETVQGFELQFGVNVLGPFALTARLLSHLLRARDARVVWVSSLAHRRGRLHFDNLQGESRYDPFGAYRQSKLADLMLALELQRRLTDSGADALSVAAHPGLTGTDLTDDMFPSRPLMQSLARTLVSWTAMPQWQGALPTLVAATSPTVHPADYVGPSGWRETRGWPTRAAIAPHAQDEASAKRLWAACEDATGLRMLPS